MFVALTGDYIQSAAQQTEVVKSTLRADVRKLLNGELGKQLKSLNPQGKLTIRFPFVVCKCYLELLIFSV